MPITEIEVELIKEPGVIIPIDFHGEPVHGDEMLAADMIVCEATSEWFRKNRENGRIKIGLGQEGRFSDKKYIQYGIKKDESSSVKVARSLGILGNERWAKMLQYVNRDDINGKSDYTDLPTIAKFWQQQKPGSFFEAFEWFAIGSAIKREYDNVNANLTIRHIVEVMKKINISRQDVDADEWLRRGEGIHCQHPVFFDTARRELEEKNSRGEVLRSVISHKGRVLKVAAINSDNYRMHAAMRYKNFAHITIVKNFFGNILISYNMKHRVDLEEALAVLRYVEQKLKAEIFVTDWKQLRIPGTHRNIKEWFYNINMKPDMIHSADSHGNPFTKLSLRQIFNCVLIGLDEGRFHPKDSSLCKSGLCKHGMNCLNLQCGLPRCRRIYYGMKKGQKK